MSKDYELKIKKQVDTLIARAEALTIKHQNIFRNSFISRELQSFRKRHLNEVQVKETNVAARTAAPGKQYRTINYNEDSFKVDDKKKLIAEVVAEDNDISKMSIDELKVYAKKTYGISTKGIRKPEDILLLIEQHKIVESAEVLEDLEDETEEQPIEKKENVETTDETPVIDPVDDSLKDIDSE